MSAEIGRVIALGASNLTRGLHTVVAAAREAWGPEVEMVAALGHGRSYGARSSVLVRALPGILDSGLWKHLEESPETPARALVTDVGNDIIYGFSPEQILAWVEETIRRLKRHSRDIVLTGLPLASLGRLSSAKFTFFRTVYAPSCRLSLPVIRGRAGQVDAGLAALAASEGVRFFPLEAGWYGIDPIHIRPSMWRPAWREILGIEAKAGRGARSLAEGLKVYFLRPERRWLFGVEQVTPQTGFALPAGGRLWLY